MSHGRAASLRRPVSLGRTQSWRICIWRSDSAFSVSLSWEDSCTALISHLGGSRRVSHACPAGWLLRVPVCRVWGRRSCQFTSLRIQILYQFCVFTDYTSGLLLQYPTSPEIALFYFRRREGRGSGVMTQHGTQSRQASRRAGQRRRPGGRDGSSYLSRRAMRREDARPNGTPIDDIIM